METGRQPNDASFARFRPPTRPLFNVHRIDPQNTGDMASTPADYFPLPATRLDIHTELDRLDPAGDVILGGGGLFFFTDKFERIITSTRGRLIGWGIGTNTVGGTTPTYPPGLERFDLLGMRDRGADRWVPCPSCMSELFDREYPVRHEVVVYEHHSVPTRLPYPTLTNDAPFERIVPFLASAEVVLTTSYHGLYWATLLGRRAVVANPFASKFFAYPYDAPICRSPADAPAAVKDAVAYPHALKECRAANVAFFKDVAALLGLDSGTAGLGYYTLSEAERLALTQEAIETKRAVRWRWERLGDGEAQSWSPRAVAAAELLAGCESVIDIGCGTMSLERLLAPGVRYIPVDIVARDARTIVIDLTASPLPPLPADGAAALGLIEYLHDVPGFLRSLSRDYGVLVTSYNPVRVGASLSERRGHAWVNDYDRGELERVFLETGWSIDEARDLGSQIIWRLSSTSSRPAA